MKSKEEVISGFLKRNCAVCMSEQIYRNWRQEIIGVYESGFKAGKASEASKSVANLCDVERSISETYQNGYDKGMEDAWNAAKRVMGMSIEEWDECFGEDVFPLDKFEASEATQILKEWDYRKEEPEDIKKEREELKNLCMVSKCYSCVMNQFFPECGNAWNIAYDGSAEQVNAAFMIMLAAERIKKCEGK